jgi:FkbM family methyltransferase
LRIKASVYSIFRQFANLFSGYGLREHFPAIDRLYKLVNRALAPRTADVLGQLFQLDPGDSMGLAQHGVYEPIESTIVMDHVKVGDNALDLGANIGYYTLMLAKLVGPKGKVFAFEPDPDSFRILQANIAKNRTKNVEPIQLAASNVNADANLYRDRFNNLDHRIFSSSTDREVVPIKAVRLDDYFADRPVSFGFIKMDIQGAEGLALDSMNSILERSKRVVILTEYWPRGLNASGYGATKFIGKLKALGFVIYDLRSARDTLAEVKTTDSLELYDRRPTSHTNLLCVRNPRLAR